MKREYLNKKINLYEGAHLIIVLEDQSAEGKEGMVTQKTVWYECYEDTL